MYEVRIETSFDAAHSLRGYRGKCEKLHGHRWKVVVCVENPALNEVGLALDFAELRRLVEGVTQGLDHSYLNETPPFDGENPSSENIARFLFDSLKLRVTGVHLRYVEVWESPAAATRYYETRGGGDD